MEAQNQRPWKETKFSDGELRQNNASSRVAGEERASEGKGVSVFAEHKQLDVVSCLFTDHFF